MVDRVRIKKYLQSRVDNLAKSKGIPISKLVEDAILDYLQKYESQFISASVETPVIVMESTPQQFVENLEELTEDEYTGGIEL